MRFLLALLCITATLCLITPDTATAAYTIEPSTWNIIGLDSNSPAFGPKNFPVGAKVCGGPVGGTDIVTLVWDSGGTDNGTYIYTRPGSANPITVTFGADGCADAFFEVEVSQTSAAFDQTRRYHITESNGGTSTPVPRELFVEHLVSQERNSVNNVEYGTSLASMTSVPAGGALNLIVGNTYYIKLYGGTATQGYSQFVDFINFSNTIFQMLSVKTDYSANDSPYVTTTSWPYLYADACKWENNPLLPAYRSCTGGDYKTGGTNVVTTYQVKIIGGGGSTETLNTLLYDFSGASYHYNGDYSTGARVSNIIDPNMINFSKKFNPSQTTAGTSTQLTFTISNPNATPLSGYNFKDTFPAAPGNMRLFDGSYTNTCTGSTLSGTAGSGLSASDTWIELQNISLPANGSCTLTVNVYGDTPSATPYSNSTTLYKGLASTGQIAAADLTIGTVQAGVSTCGTAMATWTFHQNTPAAAPLPLLANVTATAAAGAGITPVLATPTRTAGTTYSWQSNGGIEDTTTTLTKTLNNYFEFALVTTNYTSVSMNFHAERKINNSPKGIAVYSGTSSTPSAGDVLLYSNSGVLAANTTWYNILPAAATVGNGTTYFRIYAFNSGNNNPGSDVYIDEVVFTGCIVPAKATIAKAFAAPKTIAVGGTDTLTFTLSNPNPGTPLTRATFSDTMPSAILQGTVSTTAGSGTVTGSGTAFKSQLAVGSIIFISTDTQPYRVTAIAGDTSLTVSPAVGSTFATVTAAAGLTILTPSTTPAAAAPTTDCNGTVTVSGDTRTLTLNPGTDPYTTIPAGPGTCTVTATVLASVSGALTNTSGFPTTYEAGTNTGSTATDTLTALLPPVTTISFSPNPIKDGAASTLTITIDNPNAGQPLSGVTFTDTFPAGMVAAAPLTYSNSCGGTLTDHNNVALAVSSAGLKLAGGTLTPGANCTVTINVTAPASATEYSNQATTSATYAGAGNTSTAKLKVNPVFPELTILKEVSGSAAGPWVYYLGTTVGGNVYFKYSVENDGDVPLTGVSVVDDEIGTPACTWYDGGDINGLNRAILTAPFTLPPYNPATQDNRYFATCITTSPVVATAGYHTSIATAYGAYESVQYSDQDSVVYATAGISLSKTSSSASFSAQGNTVTYRYEVINTGFAPLAGPASIADNKVTVACPALTTIGDGDGDLDPYASTGEKLVCTAVYTITAGDVTAEQVTNTATATVGAVNSLPVSLTIPMVTSPPDMSVLKSNDTAGPILAGTPFNWTLLLNNSASGGAASFINGQTILTDDLPAGATYSLSGTAKSGIGGTINCAITSGTLTCQAGGPVIIYGGLFGTVAVTSGSAAVTGTGTAFTSQLAVGSTMLIAGTPYTVATITDDTNLTITPNYAGATAGGLSIPSTLKVQITATPIAGGSLTNPRGGGICKADPNNNIAETDDTNNSCPANTVVVYGPPTIVKGFAPANIATGGSSTLTITIGNSNPASATLSAPLTDTLPAGMTISAGNSGTCGGITVTAPATNPGIITMANGTSIPSGGCTIVVGVTSSTAGAPVNTIAGGALQTDKGNNAVAATATLNIFAPPTVSKSFAPANISTGGTTALSLTMGNPAANPAAVTGLTVNDTFPAGMTLKDIAFTYNPAACGTITTAGGAASAAGDNDIRFTAASLNPGATCQATVNVTSSTAGSPTNTTGAVTATGPAALTGLTASAAITIVSQPSAAKTFGAAGINAGTATTLIFTLTNVAGNPVQGGIALGDTLPSGLQLDSATPAVAYSAGCSGPATAVYTGGTRVLSGLTGIAMTPGTASCTVTVAGVTNQSLQSGTCPDAAFTNLAASVTTAVAINSSIDQCLTVLSPPSITVVKSVQTVWDPVNGFINPKSIPGAVMQYRLQIVNSGTGSVDADSVNITDAIPANTTLCVSTACNGGNPPVSSFCTAPVACNLTYSFNSDTTFSSNAGGVAPYSYSPVPDINGYDTNVKGVLFNPKGALSGASGGNNSIFNLLFKVRIR